MKKLSLAVIVLSLCSLTFAQFPDSLKLTRPTAQSQAEAAQSKKNAMQAVVRSALVATDCTFNFNSGANNTFLHYCVSDNGNIVEFETPQGHTLATLSRNEGYGVCDATPNAGSIDYHDYARDGDTPNWGSAIVVSHSATSVKIARTTSDGVWTLTQTISQVAGNSPSAKIVMTLKNNSAVDRIAFLVRYMDVDADNNRLNNFDATRNSAEGWNSEFQIGPFGLVLQNVGTSPFSYTGFVQNTFHGPDPCDPGKTVAAGPVTAIDSAVVMFYGMGIQKGKSATVTVAYKGF